MVHENNDDFCKLTFSQREGQVPLPEPMQLEKIPDKFRQAVWLLLDNEIKKCSATNHYGKIYYSSYGKIGKILYAYQFHILGRIHDEIGRTPDSDLNIFRNIVISGTYHEILTLIEFILRHRYCSEDLRQGLVDTFDSAPIAYFVDDKNGRPTIMPRFSREAGEATQQAIETIRESGMDGATTHLRQAAEHINVHQYGDSIVDSIHAVESIARLIDPKASKTLRPALDSLERAGLLKHPALKGAFDKLYGYTNDEQGIRHPLLDKDAADVGLDEAMFMFGACASFAAYLVNKHQEAEKQESDGE